MVSEVLPGGPAAAAGVRVHDVVVRIGGVPIANDCDFDTAAYSRSCGRVDVVVHRGDAEVDLTLDAVAQGPFLQRSCRDGVASACFRQAWVVWVRGKPEENGALGLFESACRDGSAEACAYEGLELVGLDRGPEATAALERACELGSGGGCATFGFLYATGKFEAKDDRRAASLYAKACDLGDAQGCYNAGLMCDEGRGVAEDAVCAAARYEEACELGSSTGCTNLGFLYEHGRGVGKDGTRAVALYQRGCEGTRCLPSNLGGCLNLGRAYRDGLGVEKDERRAAEIFREACERKPVPDDIHADENGARGCSLLGALDLAGDGVEQDLEEARRLSELGCDRGDSFGCFNAAAIYTAGSGWRRILPAPPRFSNVPVRAATARGATTSPSPTRRETEWRGTRAGRRNSSLGRAGSASRPPARRRSADRRAPREVASYFAGSQVGWPTFHWPPSSSSAMSPFIGWPSIFPDAIKSAFFPSTFSEVSFKSVGDTLWTKSMTSLCDFPFVCSSIRLAVAVVNDFLYAS